MRTASVRILLAILLLALPLTKAGAFERLFDHREYTLDHRPDILFPGPRGDTAHVSPFPMGKRAASVWKSDACWRDCTGRCSWSHTACINAVGEERCRPQMDTCARTCQADCRRRGGPALNITD